MRHELAHDERRCNTPVEGETEVLVSDVEETRVCRTADIVNQDVDAPEAFHGRSDNPLAIRTAPGICDKRQSPTAGIFDTGDRCADIGFRARSTDYGCPGLRQDPRNALPDALASAGDDRDLALEIELFKRHPNPLASCRAHLTNKTD